MPHHKLSHPEPEKKPEKKPELPKRPMGPQPPVAPRDPKLESKPEPLRAPRPEPEPPLLPVDPKKNPIGVTRVDPHEPEVKPSDQELIDSDHDTHEVRMAKARQLVDVEIAYLRDDQIIPDIGNVRAFLEQLRELLEGAEGVRPA